jgi:hypothetical protein
VAFSDVEATSPPLLRWPADKEQAECLEARGLPFLLLVGEHEDPPISDYRLMDWVRSPIDAEELLARQSSLEERFVRDREGPRPRLDESDRLSFGRASVELAPGELAIVRALLVVYRDVLSPEDVRVALGVERCDSYDVFSSRLARLRRKLGKVGLQLTRAGQVGYSLEPAVFGRRQISVR